MKRNLTFSDMASQGQFIRIGDNVTRNRNDMTALLIMQSEKDEKGSHSIFVTLLNNTVFCLLD